MIQNTLLALAVLVAAGLLASRGARALKRLAVAQAWAMWLR